MKTKLAGMGGAPTLYVDDVFSTYLYSSTGASQTITNGIDLAGKGGMVWLMNRATMTSSWMQDTQRGATAGLRTTNTSSATTLEVNSFYSTGFNVADNVGVNNVSWTFRKAAKFFDVVTYTGTGSARTIAHSLGAEVGLLIVKRTDASGAWRTYHPALTSPNYYLNFGTTDAQVFSNTVWNSTAPTSSVFSVGTDAAVNASGGTYVAYLFANNTASDGFIQAGYYVGDNPNDVNVTLGWEPQFILVKRFTSTSTTLGWFILDSMRGLTMSADETLDMYDPGQVINTNEINPTATGFTVSGSATYLSSPGEVYMYLAIRRPNKPPTSGTQVFGLNARTGTGANATVTGGQTDDAVLIKNRGSAVGDLFASRLTGTSYLETSSTAAEVAAGTTILQANPWDVMDGVKVGTTSTITNASTNTFINYMFKRAPGFFDEVCYTGTGANATQAHNLTVAPEMMIVKPRNTSGNDWMVYPNNATAYLKLNLTAVQVTASTTWNNTAPTSSVFSLGTSTAVNTFATTYVAYLFATLAGISKVGSYTGNGTGQAIACGFSAGARFVLIKRTNSTGDWYTFDSARGLTVGSSPYLLLNSTAAEVTGDNGVYASTGGFTLGSTASTTTNINGASYIFLAVS